MHRPAMFAAAMTIVASIAAVVVSIACPAGAQQPVPAVTSQTAASTPFVGNWEGVVSISGEQHSVRISIAPFGQGFAAKVVRFANDRWVASPLVELLFQGNVF